MVQTERKVSAEAAAWAEEGLGEAAAEHARGKASRMGLET